MTLSLSISSLRRAYAKGTRVEDVIREVLRRVAAYEDPAVWVSRFEKDALLEIARGLDALPLEKKAALDLFGIPFAVKDNIDCVGLPTTAACPAYAYTPAASAPAVRQLVEAGAIPIGKTNLDQFATGLVGTRSPYGAPRSVFNKDYVSGGSSSGSAVAVAAGLVSFALGTDTAGSGRVPAAFNNIVGLKPSRGLISTQGVVPACASFDCVSVFALSAGDAAHVFEIARVRDSGSTGPATGRHGDFAFAVPCKKDCPFFGDADGEALFETAISRLEALGGKSFEVEYALFLEAASLLYNGAFVAERYQAVGAFIEAHQSECDPVVRGIILGGKEKAAGLDQDRQKLFALKQKTEALLSDADFLLVPTAPTIYRVEDIAGDPVALNARLGTYTNFMNLLDMCGIAMPAGIGGNGLPYGVTFAAPALQEAQLAGIAQHYERALPFEFGAPALSEQGFMEIAVVGAHMSGLPLNHELTSRGGVFVARTETAPQYRFYALPGGPPVRPGLARVSEKGAAIELEVWRLPLEAWGSFMRGVPQPLCIGTLELADGRQVKGFLCESLALRAAEDITHHGGWRAYLAAK